MNCLKCGRENPEVRTSRLSIASVVLALAGILALVLFVVFKSEILLAITFNLLQAAFIVGIISLIRIALSAGRLTGLVFSVIGLLLPIVVFFWAVLLPCFLKVRSTAFRAICGKNLSTIGKVMIIYGGDIDDPLPKGGGKSSTWWPKINNWQANSRWEAFGMSEDDGSGGQASITSCLYLLVKFFELNPKMFVCPGDRGISEFKLADYDRTGKDLIDFWDFGPEPWKHFSYAYHMPYSQYFLKHSSDRRLLVAADRNPWFDSPAAKAKNFSRFKPDIPSYNGTIQQGKHGNTWGHQGHGQNVLFLDTHVEFAKRPWTGVDEDNIYTYWKDGDKTRGMAPFVGSEPADRLDSLLVNDPPIKSLK